jgi:hypothetical protein
VKECDIQAANSKQIKVLMNEEILIPHTRLLLLLLVAVFGLIYGSPQNNEAAIDDEKFSENKWRGVNVN